MVIELTESGEPVRMTQDEFNAKALDAKRKADEAQAELEKLKNAEIVQPKSSPSKMRGRRYQQEPDLFEVADKLDEIQSDISKLLTTPDYQTRMIKQMIDYIHNYVKEGEDPPKKKGILAALGWR